MADKKNWLQLLAYVTGSINQELLLRNEYLAAENHILKSQIKGRLRLLDYVLFFLHLGNRRVSIAGITDHPDAMAMEQMARNATTEELTGMPASLPISSA